MEMREESRKKRHIVSEAEFLARRESVNRTMVVRERQRHDHPGIVTQVGVLEDDMLVEHFVTSDTQSSLAGNIYLGRVQNVLPAMEAAFIDIGKGRNGVLYAGEVDWRAANLGGRHRKIEQALKSGDQVLVQVAKDPIGQKGPRLTTQISLAGRYLVYVPGGKSAGISRKLPAPERKRLKAILKNVVPADGSVIIRTAAEGVPEDAIAADVNRLHSLWEQIQERTLKEKESKGTKPVTMYEEPNMLVKVVRDLFNEDFTSLVVDGNRAWNTVHAYIQSVAPDLLDRLEKFDREAHDGQDAFEALRVDEQLKKALSRKVWLPSGGTLVIDRTEAMTVIDVNTGKFTGSGGNLEETVTKNNLEAAEEIVRQMRLRDLGGMIVVDFIDMVLPENQDLVLRRLTEALGRDRTRHQISEVTSLGLVQITRKRLGTGLLEPSPPNARNAPAGACSSTTIRWNTILSPTGRNGAANTGCHTKTPPAIRRCSPWNTRTNRTNRSLRTTSPRNHYSGHLKPPSKGWPLRWSPHRRKTTCPLPMRKPCPPMRHHRGETGRCGAIRSPMCHRKNPILNRQPRNQSPNRNPSRGRGGAGGRCIKKSRNPRQHLRLTSISWRKPRIEPGNGAGWYGRPGAPQRGGAQPRNRGGVRQVERRVPIRLPIFVGGVGGGRYGVR